MSNDLLPLPHFKCPKCKSQLIQTKENIDQERYIDVYRCSKCDYVFRHTDRAYYINPIPPKKPSLELSMAKTISKYSGDIGEKVAKKFLPNWNFDVIDFKTYVGFLDTDFKTPRKGSMSWSVLTHFFDEEHLEKFSEFCKAWSEDPEVRSGKVTTFPLFSGGWHVDPNTLTRSSNFGPDLVGKKDGKFYLIEIKTNKSPLQGFQRKMLLRAKAFDFIPLVVRMKVNLEIPLDKFEFEEL